MLHSLYAIINEDHLDGLNHTHTRHKPRVEDVEDKVLERSDVKGTERGELCSSQRVEALLFRA